MPLLICCSNPGYIFAFILLLLLYQYGIWLVSYIVFCELFFHDIQFTRFHNYIIFHSVTRNDLQYGTMSFHSNIPLVLQRHYRYKSLVNVPLLAVTRTCLWYDSTADLFWLIQGYVSGTCSTAGWHKNMYLVHVSLLAHTRTCIWYMFHCWLTQGHISGTCYTNGWHKDMYLVHVSLLADTRTYIWYMLH